MRHVDSRFFQAELKDNPESMIKAGVREKQRFTLFLVRGYQDGLDPITDKGDYSPSLKGLAPPTVATTIRTNKVEGELDLPAIE